MEVENNITLDYGAFIPDKSVRDFKFKNKLIANIITVILGTVMLYAVKNEKQYQLRRYRTIIFINTIIDLTFGFSGIITCETVFMIDGYYFVVIEGIFGNLPQPWTAILYSFNIFSMYLVLTIVPVQYVYRFFLICRNFCFDAYHLVAAVSASAIIAGYYAVLWLVRLWPKPGDSRRFFKYLRNDKLLQSDGSIPHFAAGYFPLWNVIVCSCLGILIAVYVIVLISSLCITVSLRLTQSKMTKKTREMQKQISYVLFFQAFVPFVTIAFPLILNFLMIDSGVLLTVMTSWAPVLNPLVTLTVVTQYRNFVLHLFKGLKRKQNSVGTASTTVFRISA